MWNTELDALETDLPRAWQAAGYATGLAGKWHCGMGGHGYAAKGVPRDADPFDPGLSKMLRARYEQGRRYSDLDGASFASFMTGAAPPPDWRRSLSSNARTSAR